MNVSQKDANENKEDKNVKEDIRQQGSNLEATPSQPSKDGTSHVTDTQKEMQHDDQLAFGAPAQRTNFERELQHEDEAPFLHPNTASSFHPTTKSTLQQSADTIDPVSSTDTNIVEGSKSFKASASPPDVSTATSNVSMSASTLKTTRAACIECQPADRDTLIALKKDPDSNICKRCCGLGLTCTYVEAKKRGRKERPKNVVSAMTNTFVSSSGKISVTTQNLLKEQALEFDTKLSDSSRSAEGTSLSTQQDMVQSQPKRRRQSIPTESTNVKGSSTNDNVLITSPVSPNVFSQATDIIHPEKFGKRMTTLDGIVNISSNSPSSSVPRPQPIHALPFSTFSGFPPQQHQPPLPQQSLPPPYTYPYPPYQQVAYPPATYVPSPMPSMPTHPTPITVPVMANNPSISSSSTIHPSFPHPPSYNLPQQSVYSAPRLESVSLPPIQHIVDSIEAQREENKKANIENKKGPR